MLATEDKTTQAGGDQSNIGSFTYKPINTKPEEKKSFTEERLRPSVGIEIKSPAQESLRRDLEEAKRKIFLQDEETKKKNIEIENYLAQIEQLKEEMSSLLKKTELKTNPTETKDLLVYTNSVLHTKLPQWRLPSPANTSEKVVYLNDYKEVVSGKGDEPNLNDPTVKKLVEENQDFGKTIETKTHETMSALGYIKKGEGYALPDGSDHEISAPILESEILPIPTTENTPTVITPEKIATQDDRLTRISKMSGQLAKYNTTTESPLISSNK